MGTVINSIINTGTVINSVNQSVKYYGTVTTTGTILYTGNVTTRILNLVTGNVTSHATIVNTGNVTTLITQKISGTVTSTGTIVYTGTVTSTLSVINTGTVVSSYYQVLSGTAVSYVVQTINGTVTTTMVLISSVPTNLSALPILKQPTGPVSPGAPPALPVNYPSVNYLSSNGYAGVPMVTAFFIAIFIGMARAIKDVLRSLILASAVTGSFMAILGQKVYAIAALTIMIFVAALLLQRRYRVVYMGPNSS
jgi:hypothetical protein